MQLPIRLLDIEGEGFHVMIKEEDFEIFHVVDTADEAVKVIEDFYHRFSVKPNLEL